jgi:hypothetical protein
MCINNIIKLDEEKIAKQNPICPFGAKNVRNGLFETMFVSRYLVQNR